MARGTKEIKSLFPEDNNQVEAENNDPQQVVKEGKEEDHQPQETTPQASGDLQEKEFLTEQETENSFLKKYKREPKYRTHIAHNTRIPKELRREMEKIAKKIGVPIHKNSGFFQQFTIDALYAAVEKAKKELGID